MSKSCIRFVIFASGKGSNAKSLLDFARKHSKEVQAIAIISDKKNAGVHQVAEEFGIPSFFVKANDTDGLLKLLNELKPDWALLAGYMRLLPAAILHFFQYRVLNIHPSLLPAYPGLHAFEKAFASGDSESGITIHLVDEGLDTGSIVLQEKFSRKSDDTISSFMARGQALEHKLYPQALAMIIAGKIHPTGGNAK